jgi:hypothetical protein
MERTLNPLPHVDWLEDDRHLKHAHSCLISERYKLVYRRRAWRSVAESKKAVLRQTITGWIIAEGAHVGRIVLELYRLERCPSNQALCNILDEDGCYDLAAALGNNWDDVRNDLAPWGPILTLNLLWLSREHRGLGILEALLRAIQTSVVEVYSVLVLKAHLFDDEERPARATHACDLGKLMRHYSRVFDVAPLPGREGEE